MCATCNHYLELIRLAKDRRDYDTADYVKHWKMLAVRVDGLPW